MARVLLSVDSADAQCSTNSAGMVWPRPSVGAVRLELEVDSTEGRRWFKTRGRLCDGCSAGPEACQVCSRDQGSGQGCVGGGQVGVVLEHSRAGSCDGGEWCRCRIRAFGLRSISVLVCCFGYFCSGWCSPEVRFASRAVDFCARKPWLSSAAGRE